ncbi:hypothetical protein J437_LFUL014247 [Ladona fulva]|uniref:XK-related protein n=1 Tax=Ladona fulva TaxID=123851 RepID=A0A8K0JUX1_LADFU|nr:hypothetical protein J437_LFUL014247 [Ladona fulva]
MENVKNEQTDTAGEVENSDKVTMEAMSDETKTVTKCNLFCIVWGLSLFFVDIVLDINAAIEIYGCESSRIIDLLRYAIKLFRGKIPTTKDTMKKFSNWYADVAMIGMMDALLESDPQTIIQLSRIIPGNSMDNFNFGTKRTLCAVASFISVGFSIASYHAIIRMPQSQKKLISFKGRLCHLVWHILITASRVISMACLVTVHPYAALIAGIIHVVVVALCLLCFPPERKLSSLWSNIGLYLLIAFAYLFYAIPVRDGPSRKFYFCMYTIFIVENVASVAYWYSHLQNYLALIVSIFTICCFFIGIFFMLMYYKYFHPNKTVTVKNPSCNYSLAEQSEVLVGEGVKD